MSSRPERALLPHHGLGTLRRGSSATTLSDGYNGDQRDSRYQWRTTWTAPAAQHWVPDFVTFDDHINRRFYSSCQMLEPSRLEEQGVERVHKRDSSSIFRRRRRAFSRLEGGKDEETHPRGVDPAQGDQSAGVAGNTSGNTVGFFSPVIAKQRKEVVLAYLKTRESMPSTIQSCVLTGYSRIPVYVRLRCTLNLLGCSITCQSKSRSSQDSRGRLRW